MTPDSRAVSIRKASREEVACFLTGAMNEGPLVASFFGADARLQAHVVGLPLLGRPLHGPPVRALRAQALARAAGVAAPAALGLLQALAARPQTRAILG